MLSVGDYVDLNKGTLIRILKETVGKEPYTPEEKQKLREWGKKELTDEPKCDRIRNTVGERSQNGV